MVILGLWKSLLTRSFIIKINQGNVLIVHFRIVSPRECTFFHIKWYVSSKPY